MSYRSRPSSKAALLDGLEEGGLRASSSYSDIDERDNDKSVQSLQDRVVFLKRLTGDIHEEVESHNRLLDRMGNSMDVSRGIMSGTMDRFKMDPQNLHAKLNKNASSKILTKRKTRAICSSTMSERYRTQTAL